MEMKVEKEMDRDYFCTITRFPTTFLLMCYCNSHTDRCLGIIYLVLFFRLNVKIMKC